MPPPPFLSIFPLGEHAKWRYDTPPQKGYLSDTCAIPHENKGNGCDTPLCDTISKGYCAMWGGVLHWAAKIANCKSLAIWDSVNLIRKAHCSDVLYKKLALRFQRRFEQRFKSQITRFESANWAARESDLGQILAIWAPQFQITSDLRCVIWST